MSLTEAGASLHSSLAPALVLIRNSLSQVSLATDQPSGTVRVNTSDVAYRILLEPHLDAFLRQFPMIQVEISLDNQLSDIVSAGFDVGILLGRKVQSDMVAVQLGRVQKRILVASSDYFKEQSEPQTIEDLLNHNCIRQRFSFGGRLFEWKFQARRQMVLVDVQGRLIFDEMRSVLDAAMQGQGIAFIYEDFVKQELESGALRRILKRDSALDDAFHLYYPHRKHMPGKLRAFVDFMRRATNDRRSMRPSAELR